MLYVQHFVIQDVLNKPLRDFFRIQSLTNSNAVVNVIVMTQDASCSSLRPGYRWLFEIAIEKLLVQFREHSVEIVNLALSG